MDHPVKFKSAESKTMDYKPVYNQIQLTQTKEKDTWTMDQSHQGPNAKNWDQIQIVVNKMSRPFTAQFLQLKDGKSIQPRTNCFRCHTNGPRLIRPMANALEMELGPKEKLIVLKWNLLIKSYGEITQLRPKVSQHFKQLKLQSCSQCHRKGGVRSELTHEALSAIKYLVKTKAMPPWPHSLSEPEKVKLNEFIYGF